MFFSAAYIPIFHPARVCSPIIYEVGSILEITLKGISCRGYEVFFVVCRRCDNMHMCIVQPGCFVGGSLLKLIGLWKTVRACGGVHHTPVLE